MAGKMESLLNLRHISALQLYIKSGVKFDSWCATSYNLHNMIKSFKHKGLKLFFETGKTSGIQAKHAKKLKMQLIALDTAFVIDDMDLPGYNLHELKGSKKGTWSITVNGNWRITFKYENGDAYIVNYEDYH